MTGRRRRTRRRRTGRARPASTTRRFPTGLVLLVLLFVGVAGLRESAARLERDAEAEGLGWVDPLALAELEFPAWADDRWHAEYVDALADFGPFHVEDRAALSQLEGWLADLSFVAEVRELDAVWPDELVLDLGLRRPVACLSVGYDPAVPLFRTVAEDGTLLTGLWERPPRVEGGWLPVLGPLDDRELAELASYAEAGDWLGDPAHLAALDVARSLEASLAEPERLRLGRIVIDASRAPHASVHEPGVRLELENRRRVLFGRTPSTDAPGELAVAVKWRHLARGLAALDDPAHEWDVLDVRWDVPDVVLRHPRLAAAADAAERPY